MPRQPNLEIRLKCLKCKDFTQTIGPIIISKLTENRYQIKAICSICNKFKSKFINIEQIKLLPNEIQQAADNTTFNNTVELNGGIILLIPLIGAIAARISALASAGGATASAIISAKNSAEQEWHNQAVEQIAQGGEFKNDVIKNDNNLQTIVSFIIAVLPEIIKTMPKEANKIKHLINGTGNKVVEVIKIEERKQDPVLSDHELDSRAITRLIGKGFNITI